MAVEKFDHQAIEKRWQDRWAAEGVFRATNKKNGTYVLDMFPYPSADGLHVGHPEGYTATDIYSRFLRMKGVNVLHPMGWDAFGLPAENFAIKMGVHPAEVTAKNIANFKRQIQSLGFSYDWAREVNTTDPAYYKWTQWIFLQLFKRGLAYEKEAPIWWCPKDKTGLANEEVVNGKCDRCGTAVEKKMLKQWMLKITAYADRLLEGLNDVDWPEGIKALQRNWIGKSEGAEVDFMIDGHKVTVFTTRPDTLFGATYLVLSPEHELVKRITTEKQKKAVEKYVKSVAAKSDLERTSLDKEKTGVFTGAHAINPVNNEKIPVWIADYVLSGYGTGAIMAVPAHDERDHAFAKKFKLPIVEVVDTDEKFEGCWTGEGVMKNSGAYDGQPSGEARENIVAALEKKGHAKSTVQFKLRDWVFSRQRYWGEPIPLVHCEKCGVVPVPEDQLPLELPKVEKYEPTGTGESPLAGIESWVNTECPKCTEDSKKEKYLIFDFDGVLGDTLQGNLQAKINMGHAANREDAIRLTNEYFSKKPSHVRGKHFDEAAEKKYHDWSRRFADEMAKQPYELFTSFIEEIQKIHRTKIAVVSSGYDTYFKKALENSGLRYSHVLAGNHHHSKEEKIETVCRDWGVDVKDIYYFTDTQADVYELENLLDRKKIIGCAWGYQGSKKLREVLPEEQILEEFTDIHNLWKPSLAKRETNTMPQWAGSCWYYLRFCDPQNDKEFASAEALKTWLPVDMYVGGAEHAVLHLLYSRFWHKVLFDAGYIPTDVGDEPFKKLKNQGLILGPDGEKMSKSRGNVINPDDIISQYGADTLRMYEMFMGPFEDAKPWDTNGILGVRRFLEKVWRAFERVEDSEAHQRWHKYAHNITLGIEHFRLNTAVSDFMKWANEWGTQPVAKEEFAMFVKLLSPFAPHLAEELWAKLGMKTILATEPWPTFDENKIKAETVTIAVQVMGKLRATLTMPTGATQADVEMAAQAEANVAKYLTSQPKKIIFVQDKLINFVV